MQVTLILQHYGYVLCICSVACRLGRRSGGGVARSSRPVVPKLASLLSKAICSVGRKQSPCTRFFLPLIFHICVLGVLGVLVCVFVVFLFVSVEFLFGGVGEEKRGEVRSVCCCGYTLFFFLFCRRLD